MSWAIRGTGSASRVMDDVVTEGGKAQEGRPEREQHIIGAAVAFVIAVAKDAPHDLTYEASGHTDLHGSYASAKVERARVIPA